MKKSLFIANLKNLTNVVEDFNTNNAWGFGGASGKKYTINQTTVTVAQASFRHHRPYNYIKITNNVGDRLEQPQTVNGFKLSWEFIKTVENV
jgi:hypothetical protein